MAKLAVPASRLSGAARKVGFAPALEAKGPAPVQRSQPWRAWYKTARWRDLRQTILIRDSYTCQRTGRVCAGKHPAPDSPVVNHKRPHRGNPELFWDPENLETVTKAEHDSAVQREEQGSRHTQGTWD